MLRGVAGNMQGIGRAATTAIAAGLAVASAATVGFAVHSLQAFSSFEKGMNEVFTLLPDINEVAMKRMSGDVQQFSDRMKILPDEVVPALYQAISAGVPQDSVFGFLEIATEASIAGVTSLETAVDGITSVVNAYGSEVIDAAQASDQMFTAVKLGKTDFDKMSRALFQVVPTAADMGIEFGNVSAALATLTAQGVPTSVAATKITQALKAMGTESSEVGKLFQEVAGKNFREFIAEGGNLNEAITLIVEGAEAAGKPLDSLFTSIEAFQAVAGLSGANAEKFASAIDDMNDSAGATHTAFERMDRGISRAMDGIRAGVRNMAISTGALIEPLVLPGLETMGTFLKIINAALFDGETLSDWLMELPTGLRPLGRTIANIAAGFRAFFFELENGRGIILAFQVALITATGIDFGGMTGSINELFTAIQSVIDPIVAWVNENIELESVLIAVGLAIASFVIPAIVGIVTALAPVLAVFAAVVLAVQVLRDAWENNFAGIRDVLTDVWENKLLPAFQRFSDWLTQLGSDADGLNPIQVALEAIGTFIVQTLIPAFADVVVWLLDNIPVAVQAAADFWNNILQPALEGVWNFITNSVLPVLNDLWAWFTQDALPGIINFVENTALPIIEGFFNFIGGIWDLVSTGLSLFFDWFNTNGMPIINTAIEYASTVIETLIGWVQSLFTDTDAPLSGVATAFETAFEIMTRPVQVLIDIIQEVIAAVGDLENRMAILGGAGENASQIAEGLRRGEFSPGQVLGAFGTAIEQEFTPRSQFGATGRGNLSMFGAAAGGRFGLGDIINTHGLGSGREVFVPGLNGEIQNQAQRTDDGDQRPVQITINVSGVPSQQQANQVGFKLVGAMRAAGIQIEDSRT